MTATAYMSVTWRVDGQGRGWRQEGQQRCLASVNAPRIFTALYLQGVMFSFCQIFLLLLRSQILQLDILCILWTKRLMMHSWWQQCSWIRFWEVITGHCFNLLSQRTDDGAAILKSRRSSAVANEEQLEQSLQSVAPTTKPKTPIVANSAVVSCRWSKSVNLSALPRKAESLFC